MRSISTQPLRRGRNAKKLSGIGKPKGYTDENRNIMRAIRRLWSLCSPCALASERARFSSQTLTDFTNQEFANSAVRKYILTVPVLHTIKHKN